MEKKESEKGKESQGSDVYRKVKRWGNWVEMWKKKKEEE